MHIWEQGILDADTRKCKKGVVSVNLALIITDPFFF